MPSNYTQVGGSAATLRIIVAHDGDNEIVINQPENSTDMTTGELQNTGGSVKGNKYYTIHDSLSTSSKNI